MRENVTNARLRGVEHQLDAHEHHDGVAPQQHSGGADGEQQRRQVQVVGGVHPAPFSPFVEPDIERRGRMALTESRASEPSGSRAAMSTALCRA